MLCVNNFEAEKHIWVRSCYFVDVLSIDRGRETHKKEKDLSRGWQGQTLPGLIDIYFPDRGQKLWMSFLMGYQWMFPDIDRFPYSLFKDE